MPLGPDSIVTAEERERGKRLLVKEAAWASVAGALYGGVILIGFAVELGATPLAIGVLAAIPFFAQVAQVPAIALVERLRERRRIAVVAVSASRFVILLLAFLPYLDDRRLQLALLLAAQALITPLGSVAACALNSWLHQLLANQGLGALFSRRLFWSMLSASVGALVAGYLVQNWPFATRLHAYSVVFAAAGAAGFVSSRLLAAVPEPEMARTGPAVPLAELLRQPLAEPNFRRVIVFMGAWNLASNLAAPFLAVYLLRQLGYQLGTVTSLWVAAQLANALTLYLWGRISDRLSNKAILAVALPAYFGCLIGLPFTAIPEVHILTLPLLFLVHVVMGAASGGISLATGNLGLKLAPQGQGTAFLASVGLVGASAGGVAALLGGALADWFAARELSFYFHWTSAGTAKQVTVLHFRHWEFLFAISFMLGWYVLHALSRIREGEEHSERSVIQQFVAEALRSLDQLFPLGRLRERRLKPRE